MGAVIGAALGALIAGPGSGFAAALFGAAGAALGGAPSDTRNLKLEDADDAEQKDAVEKCLARAVCAGRIGLDDARRRIWLNWREAGTVCR
jgi:hypothetical protein